MFPRLIVGILVTIVIVGLVRKFRKRLSASKPEVSSSKAIKCDYCGIYIPSDQIIHRKDKAFCSQGHADKGV